MKKLRAKNFRETNAMQIIERKDQTIFMNHDADLQFSLHVVLISIPILYYLKLKKLNDFENICYAQLMGLV